MGAWGHRWVSAHGELPMDDAGHLTAAGALWARGLAGLPELDVLAAVDYFAIRESWPPALADVRGRAMGIPTLADVRADLTTRADGFTRLLFTYLDTFKFARAEGKAYERMLAEAYARAKSARLEGAAFPPKLKGLTKQRSKPNPAPPEVAERYIAEARERLHVEPDDVAAEGLPALPLERLELVQRLRADAIGLGLNPTALALEVTGQGWDELRASPGFAKEFARIDGEPLLMGFPVRIVKLIPGGKTMRLVRA